MRLFRRVPLTSRPTFRYDINAAWMYGILAGVLRLASVFARKSLGASEIEVALIIAAPAAGMLWSLYWGHLASNRRKMPFYFWPAFVGRGLFIFLAFTSDSMLFTIIVMVGYSISMLITPVRAGIIRANYPDDCRGMIEGRIRALVFMTSAVVAFLAGKFMDRHLEYAHCLFVVAGVAGIVSALVFARIKVRREEWLDGHVPEKFSWKNSFGVLFSNPKFGVFQLLFSVSAFTTHMSRPAIILFLTDTLKADYAQCAGVIEVAPRVFMVLTTLIAGVFIDRWNPLLVRAIFALIGCASPLLIYSSGSITMLYGAMALWGIALGGGGIVWAVGALYFAPERKVPAYQGVHTTLTGIRGILGPLTGVWLYGIIGMKVLLIAFAVQFICGAALLFIGVKEQKSNSRYS